MALIEPGSVINLAELQKLRPPAIRALLERMRRMPSAVTEVAAEFGRIDPREFWKDVLGGRPTVEALEAGYSDPWTPDQEKVLLSMRDNRKTSVQAGHGTGKTRVVAVGTLWFLYRYVGSRAITTAPTDRQVEKLLWVEIAMAHANAKRALPGRLLTKLLEIRRDWFAIGFATKGSKGDLSATSFQGLHAPQVMLAYDEATGIQEEIFEGGAGMAIGPDDREVAIGNPTDPSSAFKARCDDPKWNRIIMDCRNHPNYIHNNAKIIPGATTREWVTDRLEEYGGEETPLFRCKVAGLWPDQSQDALILLEWIEKSQELWEKRQLALAAEDYPSDGRGTALGLDVAGEGADLTVLSKIKESCWSIPVVRGRRAWHQGRSIDNATDLVVAAIREDPDVRVVCMDDTGLGQGVTAELRRMQKERKLPRFVDIGPNGTPRNSRNIWVYPLNFSSRARDFARFADIKDELWWETREDLRKGKLLLPSDEEFARYLLPKGNNLVAQLLTPLYHVDLEGRQVVYDKRSSHGSGAPEAVRLLPSKSPDIAHSLILARRGWHYLKAGRTSPLVKNTTDAFERRTRELTEGGRRWPKRKPSKKAQSPYIGQD